MLFSSKSVSAKHGRRSAVSKELQENIPKYIELTNSDYLVPKLNDKFDFTELITSETVQYQEGVWKDLNQRHTNKGNIKEKHLDKRLGESKLGK